MKGERGGRSAAWQRRRGRAPEVDAARSSARPQPAWECEPRSAEAPRDGAIGKPSSADYCRLCHGKFSSRSLRHAFGKFPVLGRSSEKQRRLDQVFYMDFQQLLGVSVRCDPELPRFVCKDCHAQFYKCRSVLKTFIQRVNTSPTKPHGSRADGKIHNEANCTTAACTDLITSSSECLLGLVGWTHKHAGICQSMPGLQQLLSAQYCGVIRAVWACKGGHDYIMEMDSDSSAPSTQQEQDRLTLGSGNGAHCVNAESVPSVYSLPSRTGTLPDIVVVGSLPPLSQSPALPLDIPVSQNYVLDPDPSHVHRSTEDAAGDDGSSLSDGDFQSKEVGEDQGDLSSSDEYTEALPEKSRRIPHKRKGARARRKSPSESRQRKKPGPKPGWNKIKHEREELPPIFKCPYQGCTAVYRGADGMKKHVKEQHEEMRERPCPHPGCNKVFLIDRYLQRHVKLIHTEQRNYICDQCGQAFKQRKHLSVHQMRHSGAKPLQCEVCGFQCRQRASLKYHMTKHKAEADLEFACDQCGKRFEKAHNLNVHMSMVHPLVQIPSNELVTEPRVPDGATEERAQTDAHQEPPP